ncbi:MAG: hypothetical protein IJ680_04540, partial [Paludibacteraceae bacterium]|nr:hypothetical protein [Paludibacteraceae bacterium]
LDLLFFTTDSLLETHEQHAMEASERTYNIELPIKEYAHVALANVARVPQMSIANDDRASQVMLRQQRLDTVDSHPSGIYTARRTITLEQDKSQMIKVDLYMANAAVALILDSVDASVVDTRVYLHGMADGMMLRDSSYVTDSDPYIRTHKLTFGTRAAAAYRLCHYGVCFPSAGNTAGTPCWSIEVYATLADGTVTRSVMQINSPLQAGQLEVVRGTLNAQGIIQTAMTEASITVSLDWKSGSSYTPTM